MLTKFYRIWHTHSHINEYIETWHWFWLLLAAHNKAEENSWVGSHLTCLNLNPPIMGKNKKKRMTYGEESKL